VAGGCEETRLNYAALNDELMKGSSPAFDEAATNASSIEEYAEAAQRYADDLTNCGFSCVLKFFIDVIFSSATLIVVSVLWLGLGLGFIGLGLGLGLTLPSSSRYSRATRP
jgi:ABC-type dipeptide/oligopeptide/nickel transport system permease subunit